MKNRAAKWPSLGSTRHFQKLVLDTLALVYCLLAAEREPDETKPFIFISLWPASTFALHLTFASSCFTADKLVIVGVMSFPLFCCIGTSMSRKDCSWAIEAFGRFVSRTCTKTENIQKRSSDINIFKRMSHIHLLLTREWNGQRASSSPPFPTFAKVFCISGQMYPLQ